MKEPTFSPYNFVPLPEDGPKREAYPGLDRLKKGSHSGVLTCGLEVLTRLFTADHQRARPLSDKQKLFPFLRNSQGDPILQATSLKGMIRAVYEAAFPSCLPLAAAAGWSQKAARGGIVKEPYHMVLPDSYSHTSCNRLESLCPACRLFGITQGDEVHAQGRLFFSDAALTEGTLEPKQTKLAELSTPKPHAYGIYSKAGAAGGPIRGRKLYIHHDPDLQPKDNSSPRANSISDFAPPGRRFTFTVRFVNLTPDELKQLVSCFVLDDAHAHKFGMAKPLGYGSCKITVREEESFVEDGGERYQSWNREEPRFELTDWRIAESWLTGPLAEILEYPAERDSVGYLPLKSYSKISLDEKGRYVRGKDSPAPQPAPPLSPPAKPEPADLSSLRSGQQPQGHASKQRGGRMVLTVMKYEGGEYTLRNPETDQEDIKFRGGGVRWQVGEPVKVRVLETTKDGRIKKIGP